ncbi:hypothetical protein [Segetibacter aerophilus]|nr:hypothetical protein [Segetibacter aerophilus]
MKKEPKALEGVKRIYMDFTYYRAESLQDEILVSEMTEFFKLQSFEHRFFEDNSFTTEENLILFERDIHATIFFSLKPFREACKSNEALNSSFFTFFMSTVKTFKSLYEVDFFKISKESLNLFSRQRHLRLRHSGKFCQLLLRKNLTNK